VRTDNSAATTRPALVISQVYGGGGNGSSVYKNDFVEIFNPGTSAVSVTGWSVQYASAGNTGTWQTTALTGSIPAGGYYLVQESQGAGGTTSLPTADASGGIMMSATAGKVALVSSTVAISGICPAGTVDEVSFGTQTQACGTPTVAPSNTNAVIRSGAGCTISGSSSADFTSINPPTPRNSATAVHLCPAIPNPVATVAISPDPVSAAVGATQPFTATARDASNNVVGTTFTWESSNTAVATIDPTSGVATAVAVGTTTIKVTAANGVNTSTTLTVTPAIVVTGDVVISQVYGGGGNASAPYTNDYIELFNRGTEATDVTGWTVQYSSNNSTTWTSTTLSGTIQPGHYYLVQEAAGANSPAALPTPDAAGALTLSATGGKIILALPGTTPNTQCPTGATIIDRVGYGTGTNCSDPTLWNGNTAATSNTTAAFRKIDGCTKTGNITNDFIVLPPVPHNSTSPIKNCNGVARVQSTATIVINEIMGDPANAESPSWGEWFEVHNTGASPVNLNGWKIISGGTSQPDHTINADVIVPAGGYAVLGRGGDITRNGGVTLDYNYFVGNATTIWLDDADYLELVDAADARVDSVVWTSLPHGVSRGLRDASQPHVDVNGSNWGFSSTVFGDGDYGTPDADNEPLVNVAPIVSANKISISGRVATDAPLPVGFEAQLFATEMTDQNVVVTGVTFTWAAQTPSIATIDDRGVIRAVSPGTARFLVTSSDGTAKIHTLEMVTPVASTTAIYLDNAAFGEPVDADASDDFIIRRPQYTTSFNHNLGTPNWVAYDLNATDITPGQDRCNCFTFDPELEAAGFTRYTTADYTGAGAYAGATVDRGHMTRSFDRTSGSLDNARTFYFSNVVPQYSDLNQGPWANLENYLGDLAENHSKEVYIYVGPAGTQGTVKGEGKINFPASTWKIAVVLPAGKGLADVHDYRDIDSVIAVIMPNTPGVRNVDWASNYMVTPQQIETLTGYHFFSALDARTRRAVETGTKPPLGSVNGPYNAPEGSSVNMSGAGSVDPNGSIVSYAWNFGDGTTGTGTTVSHTYALAGSYTISMIVTDNDGLADTVSTTASVSAVPPHAAVDGPYTGNEGSSVSMSGAASNDPNGTVVSYAWDFGDGSTGSGANVSHTYANNGSYTVSLTVTDNDGRTDATTTTSTISNVAPSVLSFSGATLLPGETYSTNGSFTDPGADTWTATVNYGDGSGVQTLALSGKNFSLSHTYANAGTYTVTVTVSDGEDSGSNTQTVTVLTASEGVDALKTLVNQLITSEALSSGNGNSLLVTLDAALNQIASSNTATALNQLNAFLNKVDSMVRTGKLTAAQGAALTEMAQRIITSAGM
jgi:DNA/RNA endonuclease G (NUC1)/PKD repeat protein